MPTYKDECPTCDGTKDTRAKQCKRCQFRDNHPREGTGKGWRLHQTGYLYACKEGRWISQHRYVMEQHLGRQLTDKEHVHHIDGDHLNNKIENLELLSASDHLKEHYVLRRIDPVTGRFT